MLNIATVRDMLACNIPDTAGPRKNQTPNIEVTSLFSLNFAFKRVAVSVASS